jgi:hypothetical protein
VAVSERKSYGWKLLLCVDQFMAVLLLDTSEDETISSYVGRKYHGQWQEKAIDKVFQVLTGEEGHCLNNIERQFLGE